MSQPKPRAAMPLVVAVGGEDGGAGLRRWRAVGVGHELEGGLLEGEGAGVVEERRGGPGRRG